MTPLFANQANKRHRPFYRAIVVALIVSFVGSSLYIPQAHADALNLPPMPMPGVMVHLSPEFTPAILKGIVIHPENAFKFDFIVYKGDKTFTASQKKVEYTKLIKYFLASLAVPDEDQWVNLSPYEKDRMIKDDFGKTEMGRDLLAQDYLLKQITASLIYPQDKLGREFWDAVYSRAYKQFGTTNIPVNTFNKVWIVPDNADIYEKGNVAYVYKSHLKVMLEEDYLSLQKHSAISSSIGQPPLFYKEGAGGVKDVNNLGSQIVRQIILPQLEKEVNEDKNFAPLRQVFSGMILAAWFKRALRESLLGKIYANKDKVKGVDQNPKNNEVIYRQYLRAYKKGVFNYIQEDVDKYTNETIPRKYFSGGWAAPHWDGEMGIMHRRSDEQAARAESSDFERETEEAGFDDAMASFDPAQKPAVSAEALNPSAAMVTRKELAGVTVQKLSSQFQGGGLIYSHWGRPSWVGSSAGISRFLGRSQDGKSFELGLLFNGIRFDGPQVPYFVTISATEDQFDIIMDRLFPDPEVQKDVDEIVINGDKDVNSYREALQNYLIKKIEQMVPLASRAAAGSAAMTAEEIASLEKLFSDPTVQARVNNNGVFTITQGAAEYTLIFEPFGENHSSIRIKFPNGDEHEFLLNDDFSNLNIDEVHSWVDLMKAAIKKANDTIHALRGRFHARTDQIVLNTASFAATFPYEERSIERADVLSVLDVIEAQIKRQYWKPYTIAGARFGWVIFDPREAPPSDLSSEVRTRYSNMNLELRVQIINTLFRRIFPFWPEDIHMRILGDWRVDRAPSGEVITQRFRNATGGSSYADIKEDLLKGIPSIRSNIQNIPSRNSAMTTSAANPGIIDLSKVPDDIKADVRQLYLKSSTFLPVTVDIDGFGGEHFTLGIADSPIQLKLVVNHQDPFVQSSLVGGAHSLQLDIAYQKADYLVDAYKNEDTNRLKQLIGIMLDHGVWDRDNVPIYDGQGLVDTAMTTQKKAREYLKVIINGKQPIIAVEGEQGSYGYLTFDRHALLSLEFIGSRSHPQTKLSFNYAGWKVEAINQGWPIHYSPYKVGESLKNDTFLLPLLKTGIWKSSPLVPGTIIDPDSRGALGDYEYTLMGKTWQVKGYQTYLNRYLRTRDYTIAIDRVVNRKGVKKGTNIFELALGVNDKRVMNKMLKSRGFPYMMDQVLQYARLQNSLEEVDKERKFELIRSLAINLSDEAYGSAAMTVGSRIQLALIGIGLTLMFYPPWMKKQAPNATTPYSVPYESNGIVLAPNPLQPLLDQVNVYDFYSARITMAGMSKDVLDRAKSIYGEGLLTKIQADADANRLDEVRFTLDDMSKDRFVTENILGRARSIYDEMLGEPNKAMTSSRALLARTGAERENWISFGSVLDSVSRIDPVEQRRQIPDLAKFYYIQFLAALEGKISIDSVVNEYKELPESNRLFIKTLLVTGWLSAYYNNFTLIRPLHSYIKKRYYLKEQDFNSEVKALSPWSSNQPILDHVDDMMNRAMTVARVKKALLPLALAAASLPALATSRPVVRHNVPTPFTATLRGPATPGGIDLNAVNLNMHIKRDGNGVPLPVSQQDLKNIHIDGLVPVILEIRPATASPILSQLTGS